jgi:hypothetical protein
MSFSRDLADAIVRRFEGKSPSGYAQLANIVGLEGESFEVSSDLVLRRANSVEAREIRDAIEFYYPQRNQNPYETVVSARQIHEENFEVITYSTLPPEAWRYVVVDHLGGNIRTHALVEASFFTPWPLELGFHAGNGAGATGFGTNRGLDRILAHPAPDAGMVTLTSTQLQDLAATFKL